MADDRDALTPASAEDLVNALGLRASLQRAQAGP
jgi:hypothetical protein